MRPEKDVVPKARSSDAGNPFGRAFASRAITACRNGGSAPGIRRTPDRHGPAAQARASGRDDRAVHRAGAGSSFSDRPLTLLARQSI